MNIQTEYNAYNNQYYAWDDDNYEPRCPIGYGLTEQEAIDDLKEQMEDDSSTGNI